ncbi:hypothetical protein CBS101457_002282 [Exobasidium rhododendri]|nr:hypothetical protein CBS101457_002282 [Exobasidium rhododendri]
MTIPIRHTSNGIEYDFAVGTSIPPSEPHAVSVSLPKWQDNIDYEEGRLGDVMQIGYPRFFIHKTIKRLADVLLEKFGQPGTLDTEPEDCLLVPSKKVADCCRNFMQAQYKKQGNGLLPVREIQFCMVLPRTKSDETAQASSSSSLASSTTDIVEDPSASKLVIHIVLFPKSAFPLAKSFWQHTGDGISSRMAAACLDLLERAEKLKNAGVPKQMNAHSRQSSANGSVQQQEGVDIGAPVSRNYSRNRHYSRGNGSGTSVPTSSSTSFSTLTTMADTSPPSSSSSRAQAALSEAEMDKLCADHSTYLEERYGRNMAAVEAPRAKRALRKRIAGVASDEVEAEADVMDRVGDATKEEDVYLYGTGMSAIFHAHQLAMAFKEEKSVCFGFPYLDTLKILEKWGPGCFFFGQGDEEELMKLEKLLETEKITALFCEFPSNPLLRSPDLARLRQLANQHNFLIVVDETVGNFVNVRVLPFADVVVSSLTKLFTGEANGMGGCLILNNRGPHFAELKQSQEALYEDNFFHQNAIFLERNSRDFIQRVRKVDENAITLIEMLCKAREGKFHNVIKNIYHPTLNSVANYERCKREGGGYGGLFSMTFHDIRLSAVFFDALTCAKGPSLGTNFTLASPFVILAHYGELDWAASFGVESNLIRVSVGLEDEASILKMFTVALQAAQDTL